MIDHPYQRRRLCPTYFHAASVLCSPASYGRWGCDNSCPSPLARQFACCSFGPAGANVRANVSPSPSGTAKHCSHRGAREGDQGFANSNRIYSGWGRSHIRKGAITCGCSGISAPSSLCRRRDLIAAPRAEAHQRGLCCTLEAITGTEAGCRPEGAGNGRGDSTAERTGAFVRL